MTKEYTQKDVDKIISAAKEIPIVFGSLLDVRVKNPPHIAKIDYALRKAASGEWKRIIISMPPRHGKSYLCSQIFPTWYLAKNPLNRILALSYNSDLANTFGRHVRTMLNHEYTKGVFPEFAKCKFETESVNTIQLSQNDKLAGAYYNGGVLGTITGKGANIILMDDPIKNRQEAESATYKNRLIAAYESDIYTRLEPGGSIVVIATRWGPDDFINYLKKQQSQDKWRHLVMPAHDENNVPLWPDRFSYEDLMQIKATISKEDPYNWSALYMQNPIHHEGALFKNIIHGLDKEYHSYVISVDLASTLKESGDETAITVLGIRYSDPIMIDEIETIHGHWDIHTQVKLLTELYTRYKSIKPVMSILIEDVGYQRVFYQIAKNLNLPAIPIKVDKDKFRRALGVSFLFTQQRVRINSIDLHKQLLEFRGASENNDMVDSLVQGLAYILDYYNDTVPKPVENPISKLPKYDQQLHKYLKQRLQQSSQNDNFHIDNFSHDYESLLNDEDNLEFF